MARSLGDILRRFRPAVAPGPAAPAGVPVDRAAEAEAELATVFAALAPASAAGHSTIDAARAQAEESRRLGAEAASRVIEDARANLAAVRSEAASARLAQLDAERAQLDSASRNEVERIEQAAAERRPALVAAVIERVWAAAGVPPPPHGRTIG